MCENVKTRAVYEEKNQFKPVSKFIWPHITSLISDELLEHDGCPQTEY
jgi:hypothetical protein